MAQNIDTAFGATLAIGTISITRITSAEAGEYKIDENETTNHGNSNRFKTFIPGLIDAGELPLEVVLDSDNAILIDGIVSTTVLQTVTATFPTTPSSTVVVMSAFVNKWKMLDAKVGDLYKGKLSLKISGKPTISKA